MSKLKFIIPTLVALAVSSNVMAAQTFKPHGCPSAAKIQNGNFVFAGLNENKYTALQFSNYGGTVLWGFGVSKIEADTAAQAIQLAIFALGSLSYASGPTFSEETHSWGCVYNIGHGYKAVALTSASPKFQEISAYKLGSAVFIACNKN